MTDDTVRIELTKTEFSKLLVIMGYAAGLAERSGNTEVVERVNSFVETLNWRVLLEQSNRTVAHAD